MKSAPQGNNDDLRAQVAAAEQVGIRSISVLAFRDLADHAAGGSEVYVDAVLSEWAKAGLQVTLRTVTAPGESSYEERNGYQIHRDGGRVTGVPKISLQAATRRFEPADAVVEVWNGIPFWVPLWWRGPRAVVLHHLHDKLWDAFFPAPFDRVGSLVERKVAPLAYRGAPVATLSESGRDDLVTRTPLRRNQVHVIQPGVADEFLGTSDGRSATPLIVSVGRLTSAKRFDVLIRAVAAMQRDVPHLQFVIVGEGPERANLETLISELGLEGTVHLAGRVSQDDLVSWYRRAWIAASASISEGWGMTLTEASACGAPVVATNIVGHRDAVAAGAGILVDSDLEFEAAFAKLLSDHSYRNALSLEATAAASLTWERTAAQLLHVLVQDGIRRAT